MSMGVTRSIAVGGNIHFSGRPSVGCLHYVYKNQNFRFLHPTDQNKIIWLSTILGDQYIVATTGLSKF